MMRIGRRPPDIVERLDVASLPWRTVLRQHVDMVTLPTGTPIRVPVVVARGAKDGPVLGVTAVMHGNELNGVPIIHRLLQDLDVYKLTGTVVCVPIVNVPGFLRNQRGFSDNQDLNRLMPGKPNGNAGEVYAYRFFDRVVTQFQVLIDLHTASFGRINSLYVRVDMTNPTTREMALLQHPQIIVHNTGGDGTLRAAAMQRNIPAITVEIGDPQRFQSGLVEVSYLGLRNVLVHLGMLDDTQRAFPTPPVICSKSFWMFSDTGGLLEVYPPVATFVHKNQVIARLTDVFGDVVREYVAPEDAIVVGKSTNPVAMDGDRIVHLGIVGDPKVTARTGAGPS